LMPESPIGLRQSEVTIGEALKTAGYATSYIGKWHLGDQEKHNPIHHGFDDYYGLLYSNDMMPPWVDTKKPLALMHGAKVIEHPVDQPTLTERYTEWGKQFIQKNKDRPFLLYLAYAMPHVPIFVSEKFKGKSHGGLYGDVIETIDWGVGEILKTLKELKLDQNTMVIFLSDNGPWQNMPDRMFGSDTIKPWHCGSAGPLRGSKNNTYEGGLRVPAIIRWPAIVKGGTVSDAIVTAMDLYPTILKAAGANLPGAKLDGHDLTGFLQGRSPSPTTQFLYYMRWDLEGIRVGSWKYRSAALKGAEEELYNLENDPGEKFNVAKFFPEKLAELKSIMQKEDEKFQREIQPVDKY
jgi:arylsulfatase A